MLFKTKTHFCVSVAVAAGVIAAATSSPLDARQRIRHRAAVERTAAVTGLAASHNLRREGGRVCFSDHYHYGSSLGQGNERAAQAVAVKSWSEFVDLEYGSAWASYNAASGKDLKCSQSSAGWGCDLSARPCRG
jgi:hypothetical protein